MRIIYLFLELDLGLFAPRDAERAWNTNVTVLLTCRGASCSKIFVNKLSKLRLFYVFEHASLWRRLFRRRRKIKIIERPNFPILSKNIDGFCGDYSANSPSPIYSEKECEAFATFLNAPGQENIDFVAAFKLDFPYTGKHRGDKKIAIQVYYESWWKFKRPYTIKKATFLSTSLPMSASLENAGRLYETFPIMVDTAAGNGIFA